MGMRRDLLQKQCFLGFATQTEVIQSCAYFDEPVVGKETRTLACNFGHAELEEVLRGEARFRIGIQESLVASKQRMRYGSSRSGSWRGMWWLRRRGWRLCWVECSMNE